MIEFIELRPSAHSVLPGRQIIEVWHQGRFIATITATDHGAGIRVISKHRMTGKIERHSSDLLRLIPNAPDVFVVTIDPTTLAREAPQ